MKFVMTQAVCPEGMELLKGRAEIYVANNGDPNNYPEAMADADAIIVRIAKMDRKAIENAPKLKVIGRTGVGYDSVDIQAATERGIPVVITPGANTRSVAEHTVALMFALSKNLVEGHNETLGGSFKTIRDAKKAFELYGKKLGLIGLGAIGRNVASLCRAIGMEVHAFDPYMDKAAVEAQGCIYHASLDSLLPVCDFVSIHVPLVSETRDMLGREQLASMKKTAMLVNCARGGIVQEDALIDALNNGVISGAGVDVFEHEPPTADDPLFTCKNLIVSPHSAAQTREAVVNMAEMCINGCLEILSGERCKHVANPKAYEHPNWR